MKKKSIFLFLFMFFAFILTGCGECKHDYVTKNYKEATCTEDALYTFQCTKCGDEKTQKGPEASGHTVMIDQETYPSCTTPGLTEGKHCTVCNEVLVAQEEKPAKGHTETVLQGYEATCENTGLTEGKRCNYCDITLVEQEVIPAKGHTEVIVEGKDATCYFTGLTDGKYCSVCNKTTVKQEEIPALEHQFDKDNICTLCGDPKASEGLKYYKSNSELKFDRYSELGVVIEGIGSCTDTEIVIPKYIDGVPVLKLDWYAFRDCTNITKITIPNTVTEIGLDSFDGCTNLKTVILEEGINVIIPSGIFTGCDSLKYNEYMNGKYLGNAENPYNVLVEVIDTTSNIFQIHNDTVNVAGRAVAGYSKLYSIELKNVAVIGESAFYNCYNLSSITFNEGVKIIMNSAFKECDLSKITLPESIESVLFEAFKDNENLKELILPNKLFDLYRTAFDGCDKIQYNEYENGLYLGNAENPYLVLVKTSDKTIQSFTTHVDTKIVFDHAFDDCTELKKVKFTENVKVVGSGFGDPVFLNCTSLETVIFSEGFELLDDIFRSTTNLKSIYLPKSLIYISDTYRYLKDNTGLSIYYSGTQSQWFKVERSSFSLSVIYETEAE